MLEIIYKLYKKEMQYRNLLRLEAKRSVINHNVNEKKIKNLQDKIINIERTKIKAIKYYKRSISSHL